MLTMIGNLGFPIFVAIYFMTRMEKQMKEMNVQTAKLSELVNTLIIFSKGDNKNE